MRAKIIIGYFVFLITCCDFIAAQDATIPTGQATNLVEFVESIPDETSLDNPEIRNTGEVWLELFRSAKKSIDIEIFYLSEKSGEPLEEQINALRAAAERGVTIRIIADSKFYKTYPQTLDSLKTQKNIDVRIINFAKAGGGIMHAKYFIVDGQTTFLGSQNFDWRALKHIHELGVLLRNRELSQYYLKVFELDWTFCETGKMNVLVEGKSSLDALFTLNALANGEKVKIIPTCSPKGFIPNEAHWDEAHILRLLDGATKEICLQVMSYSAVGHDRKTYYEVIENAFRRAAARGVKVKIIIANWSTQKPKIDYLKSLAVLPNIDVKISTIPEHSSGFVTFARVEHCKYLVVDGERLWIGTSNWEQDYFYRSRNVGVVIEGGSVAQTLRNIFQKGWESSYVETLRPERKYTPPKRDDGSGE